MAWYFGTTDGQPYDKHTAKREKEAQLVSTVTSLAPHASRDMLLRLISICHGHLDADLLTSLGQCCHSSLDMQYINEFQAKAALADRAMKCLARGDPVAISKLLCDEPEIVDVLNDEVFMEEWRAPGSGTDFDHGEHREGEGMICFLIQSDHRPEIILKCAHALLEAGYDTDGFALHWAVGDGHEELALALLESGGSFDHGEGHAGYDPLYIAFDENSDKRMARLLLDFEDESSQAFYVEDYGLVDYVPGSPCPWLPQP